MIELTNCSLRVKQPSLTHSVMAYGILPNLHKRLVVSFMLYQKIDTHCILLVSITTKTTIQVLRKMSEQIKKKTTKIYISFGVWAGVFK
jgi:hypothetical protein